MKNIYVLPTDKLSNLYTLGKELKLRYVKDLPIDSDITVNQHIYITSDEEIKEGDWYINTFVSERQQKPQTHTEKKQLINHQKDYRFKFCKKIILTTDQDLIKDGVQAIDDEFLEWFVKNPSCEFVKIEGYIYKGQYETEYKIIIPKEEIKLEDVFNDEKREGIKKFIHEVKSIPKEEVLANRSSAYEFIDFDKQETIREVAERLLPDRNGFTNRDRDSFIEGANYKEIEINALKIKQGKMYSEEDLISFYNFIKANCDIINTAGYAETHVKWFVEQFKNK